MGVYIYGNIVHSGYMIKRGHNFKTWKKRFFTLSAHWKEIRYYSEQSNAQTNSFKGKIDLSECKLLRFGDKSKYGFEYTIELITDKRTYVFVNTFYENRQEWMRQLENVLNGSNRCQFCYMNRTVYYKMDVVHEGYLTLYAEDASKRRIFAAIDGR